MSDNPLRQHINDLATPIDPAPVVDDRSYSDLLRDRAVARRAAQANAQALSERDAELAHARPVANAAHTYAAAYWAGASHDELTPLIKAIRDVHHATTPSEVPSSHVIVERAELDWLRLIADGVGELLMTEAFDEASPVVAHLRWVADQLAGTDRV